MKVYLGGTISTDPRTHGWRAGLSMWLRNSGHTPLNPLRYQNPATFTRGGLGDASTPSSFFWKVDMGDLERADALVVVYWRDPDPLSTGYRRQSIGTWAEFGIAARRRIPIIVVTDDPDVRDHPAVQQEAAIVVETIGEARDWLGKILVEERR